MNDVSRSIPHRRIRQGTPVAEIGGYKFYERADFDTGTQVYVGNVEQLPGGGHRGIFGLMANSAYKPASHDTHGHRIRILEGSGFFYHNGKVFPYWKDMHPIKVEPGELHSFIGVTEATVYEQTNTYPPR